MSSFISNPSIIAHSGGIHRGKLPHIRSTGIGNSPFYKATDATRIKAMELLESGKLPLTRAALHIPM